MICPSSAVVELVAVLPGSDFVVVGDDAGGDALHDAIDKEQTAAQTTNKRPLADPGRSVNSQGRVPTTDGDSMVGALQLSIDQSQISKNISEQPRNLFSLGLSHVERCRGEPNTGLTFALPRCEESCSQPCREPCWRAFPTPCLSMPLLGKGPSESPQSTAPDTTSYPSGGRPPPGGPANAWAIDSHSCA